MGVGSESLDFLSGVVGQSPAATMVRWAGQGSLRALTTIFGDRGYLSDDVWHPRPTCRSLPYGNYGETPPTPGAPPSPRGSYAHVNLQPAGV